MPEKLEEVDEVQEVKVQRPKRAKLTADESLKRMEEFPQRKERIIAVVRKSQIARFAAFGLLFLFLISANAHTMRAAKRRDLPITPLTKEMLNTKVPHFYCFEYADEPQPGKRYWLRVSDTRWIERYPDGQESEFKVAGHAVVKDFPGTLVVKVSGDEAKTGADNAGGMQAFIPDKGSAQMHHWYRNTGRGDTDWHDLGKMLSVE